MVWIKICGITNEYDALSAIEAGADAIGFIFYEKSPRNINIKTAGQVLKKLLACGFAGSAAGVFVNSRENKVFKTAIDLQLDYIQFSGDESNAYVSYFCSKNTEPAPGTGKKIKVVRSVRLAKELFHEDSIEKGEKGEKNKNGEKGGKIAPGKIKDMFPTGPDYFLFDSQGNRGFYGGTGRLFDWELIKKIPPGLCTVPFILSGGLDGKNVVEALERTMPFGVDASSRLEIYPGKKDPEKLKDFIKTIRDWEKNEIQG